MTHLTPDQLVDALEGQPALRASVADHLAGCASCREQVAALAETMNEARAWSMPEPSPLFWDHFSRRVRAATGDDVPAASAVWSRVWRPLTAMAMATGAVALMFVLRSTHVSAPGAVETTAPSTVAAVTTPMESANDEALNVLALFAQDLRTDELQQVARPSDDATGAAIEDLTPAQRSELVRLIKNETGGAE